MEGGKSMVITSNVDMVNFIYSTIVDGSNDVAIISESDMQYNVEQWEVNDGIVFEGFTFNELTEIYNTIASTLIRGGWKHE